MAHLSSLGKRLGPGAPTTPSAKNTQASQTAEGDRPDRLTGKLNAGGADLSGNVVRSEEAAIRPVLSSGLLCAQDVEHDVVNDLVGRGGLDHGPDSPGQGHLAGRLAEFRAGPGQPAIQDLIVGRGQVDRDPDGFGAGLLDPIDPGLFRWARPPGRWTVRHEPSLLHVRHLPRAGPLVVPERGCLNTASASFAVSFGVPRVFSRCRHLLRICPGAGPAGRAGRCGPALTAALGKEMGDSDR
jgi:hypothetical protein